MKPTWQNTFNSVLRDPKWGHIERACQAARAAGYPFLAWNDLIYMVMPEGATPLMETISVERLST